MKVGQISSKNIYVSGVNSYAADLLMATHVLNIVSVLNLRQTKEGKEPINFDSAVSAKYPAVWEWFSSMRDKPEHQKYHTQF